MGVFVLYISWVILSIGWLACILGLFMRRLAGLEAMFVMQFSWISIFMLEPFLIYPFTEIWPLRYSAGFNYPFGGSDKKDSTTAPYFSQFKLSSTTFYINFNLSTLFQLFCLISVIITYSKLKNYQKENSIT